MNILVVGGTGFIGQRLVRTLSERGEKIFLLVREGSLGKARKIFIDIPSITFLTIFIFSSASASSSTIDKGYIGSFDFWSFTKEFLIVINFEENQKKLGQMRMLKQAMKMLNKAEMKMLNKDR